MYNYYWCRAGAILLIAFVVLYAAMQEKDVPNMSTFRIESNTNEGPHEPIIITRETGYFGHSFLYQVKGCANKKVIDLLKELGYDAVIGDKPDLGPRDMRVSSGVGPELHFTIRNDWLCEKIVIEPDGKVTVGWPSSKTNKTGDRSHESHVKILCQRLHRRR